MKKPAVPLKSPSMLELFGLADEAEPALNVTHLRPPREVQPERSEGGIDFLDLRDRRKILLIQGAGNNGKTLWMRWQCERALANGGSLAIATADMVNRTLVNYFEDVTAPSGTDAKPWLSMFLTWLMKTQTGQGAIDFGAGDTALARLAHEIPDMAQVLEGEGLWPVLLMFLSPRVEDLSPLVALDDAGFRPRAVALVLNEGRATEDLGRREQFGALRRHSVYQAALARGAVEIWMPRFHGGGRALIERQAMGFARATGEDGGLSVLDRTRVKNWLMKMDEAFACIESWLT